MTDLPANFPSREEDRAPALPQAAGGASRELDEFKQREICAIVAVGGTRQTAARYVGCATGTIRRLALRDAAFADRLKRAEADLEVVHLTMIQQAAKKNWRASAWLLERIRPDRFARRGPRVVTGEQMAALLEHFAEILLDEVPDEAHRNAVLRRLQTLIRALQPSDSDEGATR